MNLGNKLLNILSSNSFKHITVENQATGEVKTGTNVFPSDGLVNIENRETNTTFGVSTIGIEDISKIGNKQYSVRYSNGTRLIVTGSNQLSA